MADYNRVILAGRLTRDPEMRYTASGTALTKLGLAIGKKWTDKAGNKQESTTFVDCVAFEQRAELIAGSFHKGDPILIEGRLNYSSWTTEDGQKRSKLDVAIDNFQFMQSKAAKSAPSQEEGLFLAGDHNPLDDDDI